MKRATIKAIKSRLDSKTEKLATLAAWDLHFQKGPAPIEAIADDYPGFPEAVSKVRVWVNKNIGSHYFYNDRLTRNELLDKLFGAGLAQYL